MLLVVAAEQKENLRLEGKTAAILIKIGEKRVFFEDFQQDSCLFKIGSQQARQRRLTHADDALDGDKWIVIEAFIHGPQLYHQSGDGVKFSDTIPASKWYNRIRTISFVSRLHRKENIVKNQSELDDELRPEYDLAPLLKEAARDKYAAQY